MKPGDFIGLLSPTELIANRIEKLLYSNVRRSDNLDWIPEVARTLAEYLNDPSNLFFGRSVDEVYKCIMFWELTHAAPPIVSDLKELLNAKE